MPRAVANPQAKNLGTNIVGIVAEQTDFNTKQVIPRNAADEAAIRTAGGLPKVVEFRAPYTLTPVRQFYPVERLKGNPSPDPSIPGMVMGAGELHFYLDPTSIPFWLKHLLQGATAQTTTRQFTSQAVSGSGVTSLPAGADASSFGAVDSVVSGKQPKDILQDGSTFPSGTTDPKIVEGMTAAKVKITFASGGPYTFLFKGTDQNDTLIEDEVTVAANSVAATTTKYFKDNVTVQIRGTASLAITGVEYDLTGVYEHTLDFVSGISEGLTLEVQEGNRDSPITYQGMLVSRGIIRLEEVSRASFQVLANRVFPRQAMDGMAAGTPLANFGRLPFHAVPNFGILWEISGTNVPSDMRGSYRIASLGMAIDNRLAPPATSYADTVFYPRSVRKMNRELQLQSVIDYSAEANFDALVGVENFESTFNAISRPTGGPYRAVRLKMNNSQLVANPQRQVQGVGEITQSIVTRANIGSSATGNDEATVTIVNTEPMVR